MTTHHGDEDDDEDNFEYARVLQGLQLRVQNAGYGLTGLLLEVAEEGWPHELVHQGRKRVTPQGNKGGPRRFGGL